MAELDAINHAEKCETVAVVHGDSYAIINKTDFDPKKHEKFKGKIGKAPTFDPHRTNSSGTFNTPSPSNVTLTQDETEFENNHPSRTSAAEAREHLGLPDKPGGVGKIKRKPFTPPPEETTEETEADKDDGNDAGQDGNQDDGQGGDIPQLRMDGPTKAEFVKAGYDEKAYPPKGYAEISEEYRAANPLPEKSGDNEKQK